MRIYARDCKIQKVEEPLLSSFLKENHNQGTCRGQKYCYGLFYKEELVGLMTFGQPRYNFNAQFELLRLCYKRGTTIVGGSLRLFNTFLREKKPNSILSYCDTEYFTGEVYLKLGFKLLTKGEDSFVWVKEDKMITPVQLVKYGADNLIGTHDGKGTDNEEILRREGWRKEDKKAQDVYLWDSKCKGIIYKIINLKNNKCYIGQTVRPLEERWHEHQIDPDGKLKEAFQKYGKENFVCEEIEKCSTYFTLNKRERYWISKLNSSRDGYNTTQGGQQYFGFSQTEETKKKIKDKMQDRMVWLTNGTEDKFWDKSKGPYPKGFWEGRTHSYRPIGRKQSEEEKQKKRDWYNNLSPEEKQKFSKQSHNGRSKEEKAKLARNYYASLTNEQKEEIKRKRREACIAKGLWSK